MRRAELTDGDSSGYQEDCTLSRSGGAPLHDSAEDQVALIFKALGEPIRLEIFRQVLRNGEVSCTSLEQSLPISKSTISYHVKSLYSAGLVKIHRHGRFFQYVLRQDVADKYVPQLKSLLKD